MRESVINSDDFGDRVDLEKFMEKRYLRAKGIEAVKKAYSKFPELFETPPEGVQA